MLTFVVVMARLSAGILPNDVKRPVCRRPHATSILIGLLKDVGWKVIGHTWYKSGQSLFFALAVLFLRYTVTLKFTDGEHQHSEIRAQLT